MAIYFEPENRSTEDLLPGSGIYVTDQGHGVSERDRVWPTKVDWHDIRQNEVPKQRGPRVEVSSRAEVMESIKRGECATWIPNPALVALPAQRDPLEDGGQCSSLPQSQKVPTNSPPPDFQASPKQALCSPLRELEQVEIERPRSALHSGDFFQRQSAHQDSQQQLAFHAPSTSPRRGFSPPSPTTPWYAPAVPAFSCHATESCAELQPRATNTRTRAPSLGSTLSSSFVFRAPTSPLVYAATNPDLDYSATADVSRQSSNLDRADRRRTLPPEGFHAFHPASTGMEAPTNFSRPFVAPRREPSLPYQAHQPRRSLTSISTSNLASSPQTPTSPRSRKPSFSSDHSPLHHASMVGSFEESILRGRMSTAPSKPLDFIAQIGVLGRGDCKPNLRCPAHVSVPFPAVFYNYPSVGTRSFSDDSPSPYVGTIDLEHSLKPAEPKRTRRRLPSPAPSVDTVMKDAAAPENTHIGLAIDRKKRERQRKRSNSPKGPLGGCYRVPQQGQLQIVIKNPNKTAVKLFLVPYSLDGMEAGSKTFVRQRSFSAGPIMEKPLTDNPQTIVADPLQHKSILRYLIHLRFCCPSRGRYYLHDNIRVVFANRVPDGKEKLRNEVQLPEPRYSCYRPSREAFSGSTGAKLTAEKASMRRSSGFGLTSPCFDATEGLFFTTRAAAAVPLKAMRPAPSQVIPFQLPPPSRSPPTITGIPGARKEGGPAPDTEVEGDETRGVLPGATPAAGKETADVSESRGRTASPTAGFLPSTSARSSPVPWPVDGLATGFSSHRLGGTVSPPPSTEFGQGLLSRELRNQEVLDPVMRDGHA